MSNENHGHGQGGGWEPIPQSEGYDGDATAFVQLPPEFMLDGVPLEAPGHGYVPPMITPLTPLAPMTPEAATDPAATGSWVVQTPAAAEVVEPEFLSEPDPHATGQWSFEAASDPDPAATGQWTIPVVSDGADSSDESGEFTTSMLAQYASSAPATLPGGAPAPWAVQEPEAVQAVEAVEAAEAGEVVDEAASDATEPTEVATEAPVDGASDLSSPLADDPEPPPALSTGNSADSDEHPHTSYVLRVNGADRPVTDSWIGESLLYVLRERLGLAGAKDGCSQGECGACNVQVDGRLVASCLVPAATAAGSEVRTVEGLATDGEPSDVQRALARCGAVQCGFCVPGMAMTVHDLLEGNHAPTELETRQALCGNLCRCSGYRGVLDAVREVVAEREASAASDRADEARIPHQIPHPHDGGMA
ncbi:2Fe-2S iron-sulfur cluster-binding protein [Streptomyces sp. NBC_01353]|uniref:2Fe-2S iron-sulfur cluster-binding protein n=1 Tax=Streptomyces sp. NBC_01353 TaxID=2903835 RepID=UPI002E318C45|nr:2Fe-2S iron-sulfur cluster-binding protein [Streptomyces sp. NBC_01353]